MRFSVVVFFAASVASAYTVLKRQDTIQACLTTCFETSRSAPTPCAAFDTPCLCLNGNFLTAVTTCAQKDCDKKDLEAAGAGALASCKAAGVDLTNPLPRCALQCLEIPSPTACPDEDDGTCSCKDTAFIQAIDTCFRSSCTGRDLTTAEAVYSAACRASGVYIPRNLGAA
ncbi:hypothetical protein M407DRAFT_26483 [Tulasnella calospora MUT 4182]|uniref:CFEM domain-containing protein n=1 Tax=Tulasnella calospora MUT 4182 TaxID=1051891 RepID=A0A0C3LRT6_9AGAM|nr:hypothetical protein M407DRAFT_26483 [Tulasnella calospora MUT 4182]